MRGWYADVSEEELERIRGLVASYCSSELAARIAALEDARAELPFAFEHDGVLLHGRIDAFVRSYCESELAQRIAALPGAAAERPFAFEHDGVLLHGRLDVLQRADERAAVVDYKTNALEERAPDEIVDGEYRLQRLVYALACFRAGADEVEVVYHFLERPDAVVATSFGRDSVPELERELSEAIARINDGVFVPTPDEFVCATCPALDLVCAGPRLRNAASAQPLSAVGA